eukprot:scaffold536_cov124-Skeletonema_dohrnii-CCMP3373.AAC.4
MQTLFFASLSRCQITLITTLRFVLHSRQDSISFASDDPTFPSKGASEVRASAELRKATLLSTARCRVHEMTVFATIFLTLMSENSRR